MESSDENFSSDEEEINESNSNADDGSSDDDDTFTGELSMEELLKMRDKVGSKVFDRKLTSHVKKTEIESKSVQELKKKDAYSRKNKNRPQEMSSKRPVRKYRGPSSSTMSKSRDPRFDEMCGSKFDKDVFEARFSFLTNMRTDETKILRKKLKRSKNPEQKQKLKYLIQRFENQERAREKKKEEMEVIQAWKREEKQKVAEGKKPYFLKDSDKKKLIREHRNKKNQEKRNQTKHSVNRRVGSEER